MRWIIFTSHIQNIMIRPIDNYFQVVFYIISRNDCIIYKNYQTKTEAEYAMKKLVYGDFHILEDNLFS